MHWDVVFLDTTANKYYDRQVLEKHPLGGTEATVVRVAEGLGELGLNVLVLQTRCEEFNLTMGQYAFFGHGYQIPAGTSCSNYIQIRRNTNPELFPEAKKYLWMHDLAVRDTGFTTSELCKNGIQVIAVSRWHKKNITQFLGSDVDNVSYIYNPVPDSLYDVRSVYDKNLLVWTASPHKGLGKGLELFRKLRKLNPQFKLIVYNPGYLKVDTIQLSSEKNVYYAGEESCRNVWETVKRSLCVWYPCQWDETFGLIGAEANAMGVPMAGYRRGALNEILSNNDRDQLVERDDEDGVISTVLQWQEHRPDISGNPKFKLSTVLKDWKELLRV